MRLTERARPPAQIAGTARRTQVPDGRSRTRSDEMTDTMPAAEHSRREAAATATRELADGELKLVIGGKVSFKPISIPRRIDVSSP